MSLASWPYIRIDDDGVAYIEGTRTKAIEVAIDRIAHHWDADEIRRQHPHLSLAQIHSALAYYYDHQEECDLLIERRRKTANDIRSKTEDTELQERLRGSSH